MPKVKNGLLVYAILLLLAFSFRLSVAKFLPNDDPDDGRVYAQFARNLLEQHVFSPQEEPPYSPSLIRLPGYPLFIAATYAVAGHGNNTAVRIVQAVVDTATCALVSLLAFYWEPDPKRKRAASICALVLVAVCPFTTIYVATILSETPTMFLAILMCVTTTFAFRASTRKKSILWWAITGLIAGTAVFFRPDSGLFAAAIGITLVVSFLFSKGQSGSKVSGLVRAVYLGAVFSLAFCLVLLPWTLRNWRLFHVVQPLAPAHAEMPGEFVPRGYLMWLRTWLDDESEILPFLWSLDTSPIKVKAIPARAFDSEQEKQQVTLLLDRYNHPEGTTPAPGPETSPTPAQSDQESAQTQASPEPQQSPEASTEAQASPSASEEASSDEEESDEEESDDENAAADQQPVEMTPEIDAAFGEIARARIQRSPIRYYVWLPIKRAVNLWFNTHSQYYPFEGPLFAPPEDEHDTSQNIWLPIFTALMWIYTFLGVVGAWFFWNSKDSEARRWLFLTILIIVLRVGFFSTLENPEPRYVVELFPFICILGGSALVRVIESFRSKG